MALEVASHHWCATQGGSCRYRTPRRASPAMERSAARALECGSEAAAFLPPQETALAAPARRFAALADVPPCS